jgi:hypothetical protein
MVRQLRVAMVVMVVVVVVVVFHRAERSKGGGRVRLVQGGWLQTVGAARMVSVVGRGQLGGARRGVLHHGAKTMRLQRARGLLEAKVV